MRPPFESLCARVVVDSRGSWGEPWRQRSTRRSRMQWCTNTAVRNGWSVELETSSSHSQLLALTPRCPLISYPPVRSSVAEMRPLYLQRRLRRTLSCRDVPTASKAPHHCTEVPMCRYESSWLGGDPGVWNRTASGE